MFLRSSTSCYRLNACLPFPWLTLFFAQKRLESAVLGILKLYEAPCLYNPTSTHHHHLIKAIGETGTLQRPNHPAPLRLLEDIRNDLSLAARVKRRSCFIED